MGILSSLFSKKSAKSPIDLSQIGVDMHSHFLPGIDDGSKTMEDTLEMLERMKHLGFSKIITTPHVKSEIYPNTPERILPKYEEVKLELDKKGINIDFHAAAEYYYDDHLHRLLEADSLLHFSTKKVLVEFSFSTIPMREHAFFFEMVKKGYKPILAHFERYPYFHKSVDQAQYYRNMGVEIQLNLLSLTGHYGPDVRKQAELLIDNKLVDYVGTDCHRIQHLEILEAHLHLPYFHKLLELPLKNNKL